MRSTNAAIPTGTSSFSTACATGESTNQGQSERGPDDGVGATDAARAKGEVGLIDKDSG